MKSTFKKLSHSIYECKYHIVFCPKYRYKIFHGELCEYTKREIYSLISQKDMIEIIDLNVRPDHVHIILSVPPKYSISSVMGYLKGRLALGLFRKSEYLGKRYWGRHMWSRGFCVSTIGLKEEQIRK